MQFFLHSFDDYAMLASADKGTHARRTLRPAFRCVIVLDRRQPACVLCLAKNVPERPAGLRVFPEHGRQLARQTRQAGCRPPTRITKPAVAQARENHVGPCQLTLGPSETTSSCKFDTTSQSRLRRASSPAKGAYGVHPVEAKQLKIISPQKGAA